MDSNARNKVPVLILFIKLTKTTYDELDAFNFGGTLVEHSTSSNSRQVKIERKTLSLRNFED